MKKLMLSVMLLLVALAGRTQTGKDAALTSLGAFGGAVLYDTYLVIGAMGDGYEAEAYEADFIISVLEEQMGMIDNLKNSISDLKNSGFITEPSDFTYIEQMVECMGLLKQQSLALKEYLNNPTVENSDVFQSRRTTSWNKVSEILGIE